MRSPNRLNNALRWPNSRRRLPGISHAAPERPVWAATDWSSHTRTAHISGARVHYLDIGSGPPLVLLHGLGMSWRAWLQNIPDLARDHRVIAIDLPGFGDSQRIRWRRDLSGHAAVVVELLYHIDASRCVLAGHSLGGYVALHVALQMGEDIAALILISSPDSQIGMAHRLAMFAALSSLRMLIYPPVIEAWCIRQRALHKVLFGRLVADTSCLKPELLNAFRRSYATDGFWRGIRAALGDTVGKRSGSLRIRTLILAGKGDAIIPPTAAYRLATLIPDATLTLWDSVGHAPMLERPAEFNAVVRNFASSADTSPDHEAS
jgi:pimeloyl-ACP methyl ester carboxylesterase